MPRCRIHIRKEALKFAAAHMTIFPDGTKERLHGHNYRTEIGLEFSFAPYEEMIPFSKIKDALREVCDELDEKVLLPQASPLLEITADDAESLSFFLCTKKYLLPRDEVVLLPMDNVTTENLAAWLTERVVQILGLEWLEQSGIRCLDLRIDEISGQGATFFWEVPK